MSDDLVFEKNIDQKNEFLENLPFPADKIVTKDIVEKKVTIAVNAELQNCLTDVIAKLGGFVSSISPITQLGLSSVDENNFRQIMKMESQLRQTSFALTPKSSSGVKFSPKMLVVILTMLVLGGESFYLFTNMTRNKISQKQEIRIVKAPKPPVKEEKSESATNSSTINPKSRNVLKIKIFNGTGKVGEAGKIKNELSALGYENLETGNLDVQNATQSSVFFSNVVSETVKNEISSALKKFYSSVGDSSTSSGNFDIEIITGK